MLRSFGLHGGLLQGHLLLFYIPSCNSKTFSLLRYAHEQVALKRFVDDIAIEVIESKLIFPLHEIFSPISVSSMPASLVISIAGESEENRAQREQLTRQLDVLTKALKPAKGLSALEDLVRILPSLLILWINIYLLDRCG
jgi:hypothetical protein